MKLGDEVRKLETSTPQGDSGDPQGDGGDGDPSQLSHDELDSHLKKDGRATDTSKKCTEHAVTHYDNIMNQPSHSTDLAAAQAAVETAEKKLMLAVQQSKFTSVELSVLGLTLSHKDLPVDFSSSELNY